jgi:hypothetical protein
LLAVPRVGLDAEPLAELVPANAVLSFDDDSGRKHTPGQCL